MEDFCMAAFPDGEERLSKYRYFAIGRMQGLPSAAVCQDAVAAMSAAKARN
jgi:hypothetical protein